MHKFVKYVYKYRFMFLNGWICMGLHEYKISLVLLKNAYKIFIIWVWIRIIHKVIQMHTIVYTYAYNCMHMHGFALIYDILSFILACINIFDNESDLYIESLKYAYSCILMHTIVWICMGLHEYTISLLLLESAWIHIYNVDYESGLLIKFLRYAWSYYAYNCIYMHGLAWTQYLQFHLILHKYIYDTISYGWDCILVHNWNWICIQLHSCFYNLVHMHGLVRMRLYNSAGIFSNILTFS